MLRRDQRVVPLYYQVQHTIAQRISRGEYPPGSQLPSESELSKELKVSRVTIREALRALAQENRLIKVQGRGTFVSDDAAIVQPSRKVTGSLEDLYDQLERVSVKMTHIARVPVTDELRSALALGADAKEVVRIKRTRYVDDEPYAFTVNVLPLEIGSHLNNENLRTTPLVRILEEELQIPVVSAHETIMAAAADTEVAESLDIPFLAPVMHVRRVLYAANEKPLQIVNSYYRADKFHYSVHLVRVHENGKWSWSQKVDNDLSEVR